MCTAVKLLHKTFVIATCAILSFGLAGVCQAVERFPARATEDISRIRDEFLMLHGRVEFLFVVDEKSPTILWDEARSHIELKGRANDLVNRHRVASIVLALWSYLDVREYKDDACVCLLAAIGGELSGSLKSHVFDVPMCKWRIRRFFGESDDWYPHQELFNRERILSESQTNATTRANYIEEMKKALADKDLRTKNPLEVMEIFNILYDLKAYNAADSILDYLYYNQKTGNDFVIPNKMCADSGRFPDGTLNAIALLSVFGTNCLPSVLMRFANASEGEQSMAVGGGGLPVYAIRFFYLQDIKEVEAIQRINGFIEDHTELSERQRNVLRNLIVVIREKKHRAFFMDQSDWAAPKPTNSVPARVGP